MPDWRSQPRTGNSQFTPRLPEIRSRLEQGETYKQIHIDLTERGLLKIGYAQFAKYVKRSINPIKIPSTPRRTIPTSISETPVKKPSGFAHLAVDHEARKKADPNYYNPVPDLEKIYGRKETSTNSPAATPSIEKALHQERKSLTPADFRKLREETKATMDWEALAERDEPVKHKPKTFIHNPIPPADLLD